MATWGLGVFYLWTISRGKKIYLKTIHRNFAKENKAGQIIRQKVIHGIRILRTSIHAYWNKNCSDQGFSQKNRHSKRDTKAGVSASVNVKPFEEHVTSVFYNVSGKILSLKYNSFEFNSDSPPKKKRKSTKTFFHKPTPSPPAPSKTSYQLLRLRKISPNRYLCILPYPHINHLSIHPSINRPRYNLWELWKIRHFAESSILKFLQGLFYRDSFP